MMALPTLSLYEDTLDRRLLAVDLKEVGTLCGAIRSDDLINALQMFYVCSVIAKLSLCSTVSLSLDRPKHVLCQQCHEEMPLIKPTFHPILCQIPGPSQGEPCWLARADRTPAGGPGTTSWRKVSRQGAREGSR
jgi:hypothetical protein